MTTPKELSEAALRETVARFMFRNPEKISPGDHFADDLGLDSIDRLDLLAEIEQRHGVHLSDEQITRISTLEDVLAELRVDRPESPA